MARTQLPALRRCRAPNIATADVGVRIDLDRTHVHERAGLDDDAAGAYDPQGFDEGRRHAAAVEDDVRRRARAWLQDRRHPLVGVRRRRVEAVDAERGRSLEASGEEVRRHDEPRAEHPALTRWQSPSGPTPSTATANPERAPPCKPRSVMAVSTPCVTAIISVKHGNLVRKLVRNPEHRRSRQEVHVLGPAAEQARRARQLRLLP